LNDTKNRPVLQAVPRFFFTAEKNRFIDETGRKKTFCAYNNSAGKKIFYNRP